MYTDGSKMKTGISIGVFSKTLNIRRAYRPPVHPSTYPPETLAISKIFNRHGPPGGNLSGRVLYGKFFWNEAKHQ